MQKDFLSWNRKTNVERPSLTHSHCMISIIVCTRKNELITDYHPAFAHPMSSPTMKMTFGRTGSALCAHAATAIVQKIMGNILCASLMVSQSMCLYEPYDRLLATKKRSFNWSAHPSTRWCCESWLNLVSCACACPCASISLHEDGSTGMPMECFWRKKIADKCFMFCRLSKLFFRRKSTRCVPGSCPQNNNANSKRAKCPGSAQFLFIPMTVHSRASLSSGTSELGAAQVLAHWSQFSCSSHCFKEYTCRCACRVVGWDEVDKQQIPCMLCCISWFKDYDSDRVDV